MDPRFRSSAAVVLLALMLMGLAVGCSDSPTPPPVTDPVVWRVPLQNSLADAMAGAAPNDTIYIEQSVGLPQEPFTIASNQTPLVISLAPGSKTGDVTLSGVSGIQKPGFFFQSPKPGTRVEGMVFDGTVVQASGAGELEITDCNFQGAVQTNVTVTGTDGGLTLLIDNCLMVGPSLFGIRAQGSTRVESVQNTIHQAGDCGILLSGPGVEGDIRQTLITDYVNFGIACTQQAMLAATANCNDIHDSVGGSSAPYLNCTKPDFDFSLDPEYCEPEADNYTLLETSPCAPLNSGTDCGNVRIGARDVGCELEEEEF